MEILKTNNLSRKGNLLAYNNDLVKKALVRLSIEKAFLDNGKETYENIAHELYDRYHCHLPDCYEHPEYLNEILKKLYGNDHKVIVESIRKQLEEFSDYEPIARFLEVISK